MPRQTGFGFLPLVLVLVGSPWARADVVSYTTVPFGSVLLTSSAGNNDYVDQASVSGSASAPVDNQPVLNLTFGAFCTSDPQQCPGTHTATFSGLLILTNQFGDTISHTYTDHVSDVITPPVRGLPNHAFDVIPPLALFFTFNDGEVWAVNLQPVSLSEAGDVSNTAAQFATFTEVTSAKATPEPSALYVPLFAMLGVGIAVRRKRAGKMVRADE